MQMLNLKTLKYLVFIKIYPYNAKAGHGWRCVSNEDQQRIEDVIDAIPFYIVGSSRAQLTLFQPMSFYEKR